MMSFRDVMEVISRVVDGFGVLVIVLGIVIATGQFLARLRHSRAGDAYRMYRQNVGRSILLGLEVLIAADIIRTVAVDPTLDNVAVLGLIVLIRTFLSMTLEVELEGRWPWQAPRELNRPGGAAGP